MVELGPRPASFSRAGSACRSAPTWRDARAAFEAALDDGESPPVEVEWTGGQFAPGATPPDDPWVANVAAAVQAERGAPPG